VTDIFSGPDEMRTAFVRLLEAPALDFTSLDYPAGCTISLAGTHAPPELRSVRETILGIAIQARGGKSRDHLLELARVAMRVWPSADPSGKPPGRRKRSPR
jgi:hypothetical protein